MELFSTQILFGALWALTMVAVVIFKRTEHALKENEQYVHTLQKLEEYAAIVVRYAKDFGDIQGFTGDTKRSIAIAALTKFRDDLGLDDISAEQIEMLVRAAYTVMVDESGTVLGYEIDEIDSFNSEDT